MSLFDNLLRKLAEFLVVLQMFLMASCWPTPLDEYEEEDREEQEEREEQERLEEEERQRALSDDQIRRRAQLGTVHG